MKKRIIYLAGMAIVAASITHLVLPTSEVQGYPQPSALEDFITLCASPSFQGLHENPEPYHHHSETGQRISFPAPDGADGHAFALMAEEESDRYLFVIHEWWGLNDHIRREAERLYEALGRVVHVLALDLFDGKVGTTREEASGLVRSADNDRLFSIIEGAQQYAGKEARIATIGWCFGGSWSLQGSIALGEQAAGCVIYYGRPEKEVERLKTLEAPVLGIFGTQDQGIPPVIVSQFEEDMWAAGKPLTVHNYDAGHGFANPSNPRHDEAATEDARAKTLAFLKTQLEVSQ